MEVLIANEDSFAELIHNIKIGTTKISFNDRMFLP